MLGYPHDVRQIVLDGDNAVMKHLRPGSYLIDHTSSSPGLAIEIEQAAKEKGIISVDAPVTGGDLGAQAGTLSIMTGGEKDACSHVKEMMQPYTARCEHFGAAGAGQHTKLLNQMMIATIMVGICEALVYAQKAGLDQL